MVCHPGDIHYTATHLLNDWITEMDGEGNFVVGSPKDFFKDLPLGLIFILVLAITSNPWGPIYAKFLEKQQGGAVTALPLSLHWADWIVSVFSSLAEDMVWGLSIPSPHPRWPVRLSGAG